MIEPEYKVYRSRVLRPRTEVERLEYQIQEGKVRVGEEAAREIARRIEGQHGFWDFEQRREVA